MLAWLPVYPCTNHKLYSVRLLRALIWITSHRIVDAFFFSLPRHSMLTQQSLRIHCDKACSPALCPALPWPRTSQTCSTSSPFWSPQICTNWSRSEVCYRRALAQVCIAPITLLMHSINQTYVHMVVDTFSPSVPSEFRGINRESVLTLLL